MAIMEIPTTIILGGDVGSGKTTHSNLLVRVLNRVGLKAKYSHIKNFHFLSRLLVLFVIRVRLGKKISKYIRVFSPIKILMVSDIRLASRMFRLLSLLNLIDIVVTTILKQYIPRVLYKVVVFEDHLVGYVNDFVYFIGTLGKASNKPTFPGFKLWLIGLKFLIKAAQNSYILFLYAPYSELAIRYRLRGTPLENPMYVAAGRAAVKLIRPLGFNIKMLDTSASSVLNTHKKILQMILKLDNCAS